MKINPNTFRQKWTHWWVVQPCGLVLLTSFLSVLLLPLLCSVLQESTPGDCITEVPWLACYSQVQSIAGTHERKRVGEGQKAKAIFSLLFRL